MPDDSLEKALREKGCRLIAGIDEAGRGPLAGPVSAAAVILPEGYECPGLNDSKKLSAKKREALYAIIIADPQVTWSHCFIDSEEIDRVNILRATHLAMQRCVESLEESVDHCLIDGLRVPGFPWPHDGIVKGDSLSLSIAAASIVAKVRRDHRMLEYDVEFPQYGFHKHMGYGTKMHLEALRTHGPCRIHRQSFQPVAQLSLPLDGSSR
jgi:ribonuclease HII